MNPKYIVEISVEEAENELLSFLTQIDLSVFEIENTIVSHLPHKTNIKIVFSEHDPAGLISLEKKPNNHSILTFYVPFYPSVFVPYTNFDELNEIMIKHSRYNSPPMQIIGTYKKNDEEGLHFFDNDLFFKRKEAFQELAKTILKALEHHKIICDKNHITADVN